MVQSWDDSVKEMDEEVEKINSSTATKKDNTVFSNRGITVLLYGDTGCGKTFVSQTFPAPILIIDTENRAINTKEFNFPKKEIDIYEPMELRSDYFKDGDLFDEHQTIENISNKLIEILKDNKYKTIVLDSCSDLWTFIQQWMFIELSKLYSKSGKKKGDMIQQRVENQLDWKLANRRHFDIVHALKSLNKKGINFVLTAREEVIPEYLKDEKTATKNKIKCQKDVPFISDITFQLKKEYKSGSWNYMAYCEKLAGCAISNQPILNLNYDKIVDLIKHQKDKVGGN